MEYIVHVIDQASQHKKNSEESFEVVSGETESGKVGDIVYSDGFYLIEGESPVDVAIDVAGIVFVKNENGESVPISEMIQKSRVRTENASIDDDSFVPLKTNSFAVIDETISEVMNSSFQIQRREGGEEWIELHEVTFYVLPRKSMMFVK